MRLTAKDERQLARVHPDLVKVVRAAADLTPIPFAVLEGARTLEQQKKNKAKGVSWTLNSRHIPGKDGYAHAVDLVPLANGSLSWDWAVYRRFAPVVREAARSVNVPVAWGGDWRRTPDGPHWELPRGIYAAMGGEMDEDGCGMSHDMIDSEGMEQGKAPSTGPGKWATAIFSGGGLGLFGGYGYGLPPIVLLSVAGLTALGVVAFFIAIGHERRERIWDRMVGWIA